MNIKYLEEQRDRLFREFEKEIQAGQLDQGWDGYNADPVTMETITRARIAVNAIIAFFRRHEKVLHRFARVDACPSPDGNISVMMLYDDEFEVLLDMEAGKQTLQFHVSPKYRKILDGSKTIADNDFQLAFCRDTINKTIQDDDLVTELQQAFFEKRWIFSTSGSIEASERLDEMIKKHEGDPRFQTVYAGWKEKRDRLEVLLSQEKETVH